jgi:uncharacterized protein (TIGR02996 family)
VEGRDIMSRRDLGQLHRAILLDPADDLARLAYADELESAGEDARAEAIRLDIAAHGKGCADPYNADCVCPRCRWNRWWDGNDASARRAAWGIGEGIKAMVAAGGTATVDRGFLRLVRCPLAVWLDGTGAAMVASHPLERVELAGKKPLAHGGRHWWLVGPVFSASIEQSLPAPAHLPWPIFSKLPGQGPPGLTAVPFATAEDAVAALSLACLNLWRPGAGLPLLAAPKAAALAGA